MKSNDQFPYRPSSIITVRFLHILSPSHVEALRFLGKVWRGPVPTHTTAASRPQQTLRRRLRHFRSLRLAGGAEQTVDARLADEYSAHNGTFRQLFCSQRVGCYFCNGTAATWHATLMNSALCTLGPKWRVWQAGSEWFLRSRLTVLR